MQNNLKNIEHYIDDAYELARNNKIDLAVEHFFTLRNLLKTSNVDEKTSSHIVDANTKIFVNEALKFNRDIKENDLHDGAKEEILIIGDSLQLPRPEEKKLENGGIHRTTSYVLQDLINKESLGCRVNVWSQRYFTTKSLLENWDSIVPEFFENTHFILHLGLNDYVERMFLEEERLAMNLYSEELKNKIVKFAQIYRSEIIDRQLGHSYVPFDQYKKNVIEIIVRAKKSHAKSISLINVISFPSLTWERTPRCMWNTSRINMFLYDVEQEHNVGLIDLDRLIWESGLHENLLADKMHLSQSGHNILADEILKIIKGRE